MAAKVSRMSRGKGVAITVCNVRRASKKDIPAIMDLLVQVNMVHHNGRPDLFKGPTTKYTYNLTQGQWTVFPLSDGNGAYKVTVYQSVDDKYASVLSLSCDVSLADEFVPFLRPNQYVNYARSSTAVSKAAELTAKLDDPLKKVEAVYDYVVGHLKHPPLSGWIGYLFAVLSGYSDFAMYFAAQLFLAVGAFYVYRLGRLFLDETESAAGVLLLYLLFYYNPSSMKFCSHFVEAAFMPAIRPCAAASS